MARKVPSIDSEIIIREDGRRSARLTVRNGAKLNVLDAALSNALGEAARSLARDPDLRAVVLTGEGERAFIGGADIREMAALDAESARQFITTLHEACAALRQLPVPVIARIQGYCLGGGLEVAAACDLRVAAEDSRFGMPEVRVGIPSVIEAALLPGLVGWGKARELMFTGEMITAAEAHRCGLVDRVVPAAQLDDAVEDWVGAIARAGPLAIRAQKALFARWQALPLEQAIEAGIEVFLEAYRSDEPRRMMEQFLERRG